ncbi:MAG TPA: polyhydroxyalkanoate synthesis repressor PhaR [Steroidobacteraceae bacterium]|jgi:polyhydroxyalkanoate synthesis repressor PhaR
MPEERLIRKYANRRFYDPTGSRHVTLDDIRKMIGAGERVKVLDDQTGEDLTRQVLLQIIANQEQFGTPVLSTQLLEALVRFYGNPIQELLTHYLEQSIGGFLRQQQLMRVEMAKALESPLAPLADLARRNMELWARMQASMLSAFQPAPASPAAGGPADNTRSAAASEAPGETRAHDAEESSASQPQERRAPQETSGKSADTPPEPRPRAGRVQPPAAGAKARPPRVRPRQRHR